MNAVANPSREVVVTKLSDSTLIGLLNSAPDALLAFDASGLIVMVNHRAEDLFGYRQGQLLGLPVDHLVPLSDPTLRRGATGELLVGRRSDANEFLAEVSVSTMMSETGPLTCAAIRDTTQREAGEANRALDKVEAERVRLVAEGVRVRAEGEKEEAEIVRLELEAERVKAEGEKEEAEIVRLEVEAEHVKAEGEKEEAEIVRLQAEAQRIKAEGEKEEAEIVRLEAEAEHGRIEAQLHQSQRLESLGQLAGGVAHDFNNLLAVILNYASFVAEELTSAVATPDGAHWAGPLKDLEQIQVAAERATLLTHQLLSFARREVVQARPLRLNSAITRMEQILRRTIGEQVELKINLGADLPLVVADPGQIEQIILNLAINARDAMSSGGTLSLDTSFIEITGRDDDTADAKNALPGTYVVFRVSDTGEGMSEEVRDRAFEPFFTTKSRGEGAGLGLATVYGIVSQSGGFTKIFSDVGVGTAITVLLPAAQRGARDTEYHDHHDNVASLAGSETILVVDDETALREVTERILTRNGYTVLSAASGSEALALGATYEGTIDVVLTDLIMPVMQGPEVVDQLKLLRPDIGVLFMSGHALPVLESELELGTGIVLVEKPFNQTMLLEKIREVLDCRD